MMEKTFKIEFKWLSDFIHGSDVLKALTDKTYGYALCQFIAAVVLGFVPFILTLAYGRGFVMLLLMTFLFSYPLGGNLLRWAKEMSPKQPEIPVKRVVPENEQFNAPDLSELMGKPKINPRVRKKIVDGTK